MLHQINVELTVESSDVTNGTQMRGIIERVIRSQVEVRSIQVHANPVITRELAALCAEDRRRFYERYHA